MRLGKLRVTWGDRKRSITLDELEERHLEHDPTWQRVLDAQFGLPADNPFSVIEKITLRPVYDDEPMERTDGHTDTCLCPGKDKTEHIVRGRE